MKNGLEYCDFTKNIIVNTKTDGKLEEKLTKCAATR